MSLMKMQEIINNIVEKMEDPLNLEAVNLKNVEKGERKNTSSKSSVVLHPYKITETNLLILVGTNVVTEIVGKKNNNNNIP